MVAIARCRQLQVLDSTSFFPPLPFDIILRPVEDPFPRLTSRKLSASSENMSQFIGGLSAYTNITKMVIGVYDNPPRAHLGISKTRADIIAIASAYQIQELRLIVSGIRTVYADIQDLERCRESQILDLTCTPMNPLLDGDVARLAAMLSALRSITIRTTPLSRAVKEAVTRPTLLALGNIVSLCPVIEYICLDIDAVLDQTSLSMARSPLMTCFALSTLDGCSIGQWMSPWSSHGTFANCHHVETLLSERRAIATSS